MIIDLADEEECKENKHLNYHLLTSQNQLTPEELDSRIEAWMQTKLGITINFDINGPLDNLANIFGKLVTNDVSENDLPEIPLLRYDKQGFCNVLPLNDAKKVIDYVWDNAFNYNGISL